VTQCPSERIWKTAAGAIKAKISDSRDLIETYKKESGRHASMKPQGRRRVSRRRLFEFPFGSRREPLPVR
jgi:hypothetical protein